MQIVPSPHLFSSLRGCARLSIPLHILIFVTEHILLIDSTKGSGLVRGGDVEEKIKERLTHTMRLSYFLIDSMLAYFSFAN